MRGGAWIGALLLAACGGEGGRAASPADAAPVDALTADAARDALAADAALDAALDAAPADAGLPPGLRYDRASFLATHNSYAGAARGSIAHQLDRGVRFVELDLHDDDFATVGDFRVGHDSPGQSVGHGNGNPDGDLLADWLRVVANWSAAHPGHVPITLAFDLKDDLSAAASFGDGDPNALAARVEAAFGERLLRAEALAAWPAVEDARGRVLTVLSGSGETRLAYLRDRGHAPAVAMDAGGRIVEVHEAGGALAYWTGRYADGRVAWARRGRWDAGGGPVVALSDEGWVVAAHDAGDRVGRLGDDLEVAWGDGQAGDAAPLSLRFTDGLHVHEVLDGGSARDGVVDPAQRRVVWGDAQASDEPPADPSTAEAGDRRVHVFTAADDLAPADTLQYATATVDRARIRYRQTFFIEVQPGDAPALTAEGERGADLHYFAASSLTDRGTAAAWRARGFVVRQWAFDAAAFAIDPPANFLATDLPDAAWYLDYVRAVGAVR